MTHVNDFEQCLVHSKCKVNTTILVSVIALIIKWSFTIAPPNSFIPSGAIFALPSFMP